jgi:hypothetical protein
MLDASAEESITAASPRSIAASPRLAPATDIRNRYLRMGA